MRVVVVVTGLVVVVVATALSLPDHDVKSASSPLSSSSVYQGSSGDDCDEGLPPPDRPFYVVWNHPDTCKRNRIPLHLDHYGFIFNKNRLFLGEEIQTLYNTGLWPNISETGEFFNGGLPQLFTHHDYSETVEILGRYRTENFTGLGILDFEEWRAIYDTNFGIMRKYQDESIKLAKQRYPSYNKKELTMVAEQEWDQAAREIMSTKLAIGQALMPGGHWGYYGYPRTWGSKRNTQLRNNRIDWLWRQSTGLYPSIYIKDPNMTESAIAEFVSGNVEEAVRVQDEFSPPNTPIYPYAMLQSGDHIFFQVDHLKISLGLPAKMGTSGVILWASSNRYKNATRQCSRMRVHIDNVLGPYVENLTQVMADCSTTLCGGHGRCVHNSHDVLLGETDSQRLSGLCTPRHSRFRDYHCRCYSDWEGACCQTVRPSRCHKQQQGNVHEGGDLQEGHVVNVVNPLIG
uniref:Hyaluronidase conohyal-P1 n=1 Tax=Conus purpurascens TaxID=41690 RepID=HYAL_CONPU|nr:RecName: Full=Hyaluronidase conohyal-P1; AltName: Full=Hyaluronoglucosaminidase; Flags: Precursor [Conus purpurascens]